MKVIALSPENVSSDSSADVIRFHLSLNVANLERSIRFLEQLLGRGPAKQHADYAKFELDDPPLVLSLEPNRAPRGGSLNHLGFRMPNAEALVAVQRRLEMAGISTRREEGVECCYSRQTKFWVEDPDGNLWEIYIMEEDLDCRGDGGTPAVGTDDKSKASGPALAIWTHRLKDKFPSRLPILDQTVDQVQLEGMFNERLAPEVIRQRLGEVHRVLRPSGIVKIRMLSSDRPTGDSIIQLPGPAAAVEVVPQEDDVIAELTIAGFTDIDVTFRSPSPWFKVGPCVLRETRMEARRK